jgi:hypothetical protein
MMASCVPLIRQLMHSCARLGCLSTYSWNIISPKVDGLLQQVHLASFRRSPLNPQYLTKKQSVFQKIVAFVEKFKGVGGQV